MIENYEHYITKNIKAFYRRRLFSPILYLALLALLWLILPLNDLFYVDKIAEDTTFDEAYETGNQYVKIHLNQLNFTGYTRQNGHSTSGYYYYGIRDSQCVIVLLSPSTCEQGLPVIEDATVTGKIIEGSAAYEKLLSSLAQDLEWTPEGIASQLSPLYLSEPDYHIPSTRFFAVLYFGSMLYAMLSLLIYVLYIAFPVLSPACQNLVVYGSPKKMLEEAEEELATLPQLATEDMFITEHYFIATSPYGNAIVPIQKILWIYKYSTLHKFLWYHFSISYTLHISAKKHIYIRCPKNSKSDIDGIIDYLSEANHKILVGFNEENRLKAQAVQGKPLFVERLYALLRKRV